MRVAAGHLPYFVSLRLSERGARLLQRSLRERAARSLRPSYPPVQPVVRADDVVTSCGLRYRYDQTVELQIESNPGPGSLSSLEIWSASPRYRYSLEVRASRLIDVMSCV